MLKIRHTHMMFCAAALAAFTLGAEDSPGSLPRAAAVKADTPPVMDGKLGEEFWKRAEPRSGFTVTGEKGSKTDDTTFRAAYDDKWLYLGFECKNPKMRALLPKVTGHDKGASNDDSVEIFLDPGASGRQYFHYMLACTGAKDERRVIDRARETQWDVPWRSAVSSGDDGWTAEVAIPLYVLASYGSLDNLKLNIARNRRNPTIDAQGVSVSEVMESSSWSPVLRGFHEPDRFGFLDGIRDIRLKIPLLVGVSDITVKPYYFERGGSFYDAELSVAGQNAMSGEIEVAVEDKPVSGRASETVRKVGISGTERVTVRIPVPVASLCKRDVHIRIRELPGGELIERIPADDLSSLNIMTAYTDRNYYTTETAAKIICNISLPESSLAGMEAVALDSGKNIAGRRADLKSSCAVDVALGKLGLGVSELSVELRKKSGEVFFSVPVSALRRKPNPGLEWKIDRERRLVLDNGKPFFPVAMFMDGVTPDNDGAFRKLAETGFNTIIVWAVEASPAALAEYQKKAAQHNLFVISQPDLCAKKIEFDLLKKYSGDLLAKAKAATARQDLIALKKVGSLPVPPEERAALYGEFYSKNIANCIAGVDAVKNFKNLCAYFIFDEPVARGYFDQCQFGMDYYRRVNEADGYHPVLVNYSTHIPDGDEYINWCDILMTDPYWSPARVSDGTRGTVNFVSKLSEQNRKKTEKFRQAVWITLAGPLWSGCRKRAINRDEQLCQTYLALIHGGATGICYFAHKWVRDDNWNEFRQIASELKTLTPALTGPLPDCEITYRRALLDNKQAQSKYSAVNFNPGKEEYPEVQVGLRKKDGGGHVLLAANSAYYPVTVSYKIQGLTGSAENVFTKESFAVKSGAFGETLPAFATRAYNLKLPASGKIKIEVSAAVVKSGIPPKEAEAPFAFRPGKKNILANPSFEDESIREIPDYTCCSRGVSAVSAGALFGKKCLKFVKTANDGKFENIYVPCDPQLESPQPFVFSLYMKGSRDGLKAYFRGTKLNEKAPYGEEKSVSLTTDWKRYYITGMLPAKLPSGASAFEIRLTEPGEMLVDGMQLEKGYEPTEYSDN